MESKGKKITGYPVNKLQSTTPPLFGRGGRGVRLFLLLITFYLLPLTSFGQEPPIGSQALADSVEARDQRATKKFQQTMDRWLITDFARVGLIANTLVKTSPFLQYPAMNPELGAYLSTFEQETGATIILRAYIDIPYFNPWVTAYKSSQKTRKAFEISKAKPAHAVIDIVYSPSGMKSKYEVAGYNITVRDSLRTPAFKEIFSETDFLRMRDTLQAAMGQGPVQTIDSTRFNAAVIRALEALKGDTKTKPDPGYKVTFRKGDSEGYDSYKYPALNSHYQRDAAGNPMPWLALDTKKSYMLKGRYQVTDPAAAKETPLNIEAADLIAGTPSIQDTLITQSLSPAGKARELTAEANYTRYNRFNKGVTTVAGQIALAAYEKLDMKLVVVYEQGNPLSFSLTDLKKYMDDVYGQAVVSWDVQSEAFDYSFPNEVAIGNSALSSYSSQMNTIIKAFKKSTQKIDGKTYYVFMVPSLSGGANGYMPMKGQFGFVKNTDDPAHTIAHELGHGAFRLWHTFREKDMVAAQGMTDNLMDYTDGKTRLYKHQWDLVHDPETMLMPFLVSEDDVLEKDPDQNLGLRINALAVSLGLKLGKDVFAIIHSINCSQLENDAKTQEILINKERVQIEGRYTPVAFQIIPARNDQGIYNTINTVVLFQINGNDSIGFHSKIEYSNTLPSQIKYTPFLGVLTTEKLIECKEQLHSLDEFVCKTGSSLYEELLEDNYQGFYIVQLLKAIHNCLLQTESEDNSQKFGDRFYTEIIEKNANNVDLKQLREVSDHFNEIADILFKNQNTETWNEVKDFFHATYSIPDKSPASYANYLKKLQYFIDNFKAKQQLLADLTDRESAVTIITILNDTELKLLPMKLRSKALNILASKKLRDAIRLSGDNEENLVLRLIANVNQDEIPQLLDELRKSDLLNTLDKEFNDFITIADDNYTLFLDIIDKYALEQKHIGYSNKDEWLAKLFENDQSFDLTGMLNGRKYISASKVLKDGKVQLTLTKIKNITFEWKLSFGELKRVENRETESEVIEIDYDSPVSLYHNAFLKGVDVSKRHQYEIVTALRLHYYLQSYDDAVTKQGIWTTIDIVTFAVGIGEISVGAKSALRLALAIANTASSTASLLSTATEKYLIDEYGPDGVEYVNAMHRISAVLGAVDMGYSGYKLIEKMLLTDLVAVGKFFEKNSKKLFQENQTKEIAENTKYLVDNFSDEIKLIVKNSQNTSKVIEDFLVAKKLKGSQIEILLSRATNNQSEILSKLKLWEKSPNLYILLNNNLAKYSKLTDEMLANPELIDYFAKAFDNWYSALGIQRQINNRQISSPAFCDMIGDIEVTYAKGLRGKLRTTVLDEAQGVHLGDIFDYYMEQYVISFWQKGIEPNLPDVVINRLKELKNKGYELVIKPKVSISGNNPIPDMLFIKFDKQTKTFDFNDCIYIDNKYSPSSPFSGPQNQIIIDFSYYPNRPWAEVIGVDNLRSVSGEQIDLVDQTLKIKEIQSISINNDFNIIINPIKP